MSSETFWPKYEVKKERGSFVNQRKSCFNWDVSTNKNDGDDCEEHHSASLLGGGACFTETGGLLLKVEEFKNLF